MSNPPDKTGRPEPGELPHDRVGITDDTVGTPRERSARERIVRAVHEALGIGGRAAVLPLHLGQVSDRAEIRVVDDVSEIVVRILLRGPADDAHRRPHLDVAAALACQPLRLRDPIDARLGDVDRVEVHVRVTDRECASRR